MKLNLYSIFDKKARTYNTPFYLLNDEIAKRTALDLVKDHTTTIAKHPQDFILFRIGEFDDQTGHVQHDEKMPVIVNFHEIQLSLDLSSIPSGSPTDYPDEEEQDNVQ